jgi:hypothetical protein
MVRSISVALLVSTELEEFASGQFPELMSHPDFRDDALQELRMVELGETDGLEEKVDVARRALAWLSYELGLRPDRPTFPRVDFLWLKDAVSGTFLRDTDRALESLRVAA